MTVIYDIFAEYLRNGIQYVVAHRFCGIKTAHVKVCVAVFQICINGNCIGFYGFGIVAVVHIRGHNFCECLFCLRFYAVEHNVYGHYVCVCRIVTLRSGACGVLGRSRKVVLVNSVNRFIAHKNRERNRIL